jgi:hypothetical protein
VEELEKTLMDEAEQKKTEEMLKAEEAGIARGDI